MSRENIVIITGFLGGLGVLFLFFACMSFLFKKESSDLSSSPSPGDNIIVIVDGEQYKLERVK